MSSQPNFLLIITDQQRADHLGCYGNRAVRTPAVDAPAANGWCADEFFTATPICMPNRSSLMTGRMPSRHGVRHNGIELSFDETNFVETLRSAGYGTALVGKSHLQNIEIIPPSYPRDGEPRHAPEARREGPGRHGQEIWKRWEDNPGWELDTPFYVFERHDLVIHHADTAHAHDRPGECAAVSGPRAREVPAGMAHPRARGALSDELDRRAHHRARTRVVGERQALVHPVLVSRSASPLYPARALLRRGQGRRRAR